MAVKEISVKENNRTQMWCKVPFLLPTDAEIVWRYAMERTMLMDRFDEVTVGVDLLYFIPSARPEHSGTYQCEIFSQEHSLVRIYYYVTVVPMAQIGHAELQDVFEQALLPGGQFFSLSPTVPFTLWLPSPALVTTCLTAILLLVFIIAEPPEVTASAAEPPEAAGVFASAPLKTGVSTYEPIVCPDKVMETVSESPVKPVTAIEANQESLSELIVCPVMVKEAIYKLSACPVMAL
ncbi:uncharacterized protein LOC113095804 [Carassius auratus]|uniref:Uncharacterized protein LOC113095804 n=1 Tax=Carassius auratus TaxID=7957 RepID=A0A6P6P8N5_CARAU|nr:uncharacterized protein LOC113095804 [Carassius auratus]